MRSAVQLAKLNIWMEEIGRMARGSGRIYLTGGSSALLLRIREQTVDIDIKLDPEPLGVFEAIATLKDRLDINIELAAPEDFIPPLPGWRERSEFIRRCSEVEFFHYDFYSQALSKIVRGHDKDISDARALVSLGKVELSRLEELFHQIIPQLQRYPALREEDIRARVDQFLKGIEGHH